MVMQPGPRPQHQTLTQTAEGFSGSQDKIPNPPPGLQGPE